MTTEAVRRIEKASSLALACHIGPDGDALGSMLGFGLAAVAAGKEVVASFGNPFDVPSGLAFLPGQELLVAPERFPETPEVMVVFDAGSAERLGELASNAGRSGSLVVLDHHVTNEGFGDVSLVDGAAAATGEIVHRLLGDLGWPVTPEVAQCLLTALITDTGRFQYASTSPGTLRLAAELLEAGGSPPEISRHVYEEAPFGYLKIAALTLGRARLHPEAGVVTAMVSHRDLGQTGVGWGDVDNLIDLLRLAVEADVAVLAKVHDDGRVKVSLRSRGATDVGGLAMAMGGGGHRLAAGFTSHTDAETVLTEVVKAVGSYR